ncbi:Ppx/GppA family phosphatase [Sphingomonas sp. RP10(2022)]|uniref:Ppx/GppA family phosphatase n=1 Tax=Sphingomonas liriopis TaxID=2949094 RepID=A0A9X2HVU3_9SPHN|nr:Ppx/GppA family phosphatase [Sphingomonas liriopis]MCP3733670.1 Ppx/GppA family phosphatase [Sphingomonas liriopis]
MTDYPRTGIIDIGSNSVRLVVYQGHPRIPATLFNEKVMAGLGRSLAATGAIDADSMTLAIGALRRFAAVAREMDAQVRTVATAAVRDASNGADFLVAAKDLGLAVELLSGEQEATAAGMGVLSAIPDADGIVGDLGGGSLELVRVVAGTVTDRVSFPLGVLRIAALRESRTFDRHVSAMIRNAGWTGRGRGLPLYMVGGSWRALARLDMSLTHYPLPIIHGYALAPETVARLGRSIAHLSKQRLRAVPGMSAVRAGQLGDATALLSLTMRELGSTSAIASTFGLREGLLFAALDRPTRALDPLIVAAREEGRLLGRFAEHGDLLADWIAPLFPDDAPHLARIRHAACLLADTGWRANPEFRDERGFEVALHGNWVAIEASERAMLSQALHTSLGGGTTPHPLLFGLANAGQIALAIGWGLAIRLGQRFSGGLAGPLQRAGLSLTAGQVVLELTDADRALYAETVERRHAALATALRRKPALSWRG